MPCLRFRQPTPEVGRAADKKTVRVLIEKAAAGADILDLMEMGKALPAHGILTPNARERLEQAIAKADGSIAGT